MSLPLPYGKKRAGAEREAPARGASRPYAERLKDADVLVEKARPSQNSFIHALPEATNILLIIGAFAPVVFAQPDVRRYLFEPLAGATSPFSMGLAFASEAVWSGWQGALLISLAGLLGFLAWAATDWNLRRGAPREVRQLTALLLGLLALGAAVLAWQVTGGQVGPSAAAAWIVITGAAGVYGAWHARARTNFNAAVGGAVALMLGGRLFIGGVALVFLALCDREFPGQAVAKYSWRRSQVAIAPVRAAAPPQYTEGDFDALHRARWTTASAPTLAGFMLLIGGLAPFAYWPPLRSALLGPLVEALMPATTFVPIVSDAFWSLNPLFVAYIGVTSVVALAAMHFAMGARRPSAVAVGAVALIASGRLITGIAVLVVLLLSYGQYGEQPGPTEGHHAAEPGAPSP